eukprot:4125521-Lingulodinium_polyedra.AAC.1
MDSTTSSSASTAARPCTWRRGRARVASAWLSWSRGCSPRRAARRTTGWCLTGSRRGWRRPRRTGASRRIGT